MTEFTNFAYMHQEAGLMVIFIALLVYDIFASGAAKKYYGATACALFALHTASGFLLPAPTGEAFGGMFINSNMTVLMKNILNLGTLFVFLQAGVSLKQKGTIHKEGEFYVITLATLLGMYLMVSAGNFMLLYIGIEAASLPLACLAAFDKYKMKSAEAGAKYILISALSSGVMMFGLSYLYGALGTMYFGDMAMLVSDEPMVILGFAFFFAGLAFKISLAPFHLWAADVYEGAPTAITAYLSVVSKGAGVFALIFSLYRVFGGIENIWHPLLWVLSLMTITIGNLFAMRQTDVKRFFAFSSVSQAGYIVLGVFGTTEQGMTAMVYYILVYVFSNLAAFGVIAAVENHSGQTSIAALNGLGKSNPALAWMMMLAVFSLAGIPPFAGFFSKFFVFASAASQGEYLLVFIALLNTVISLYYYLLIVKAMFINPAGELSVEGRIGGDVSGRIGLILCTGGVLLAGVLSSIYGYVEGAGA